MKKGKKTFRKIIVFTRYPEPGTTKTRLISALGSDGAAKLQREMTEYTMRTVREFSKSDNVSVEVRYEGGSEDLVREWLGSDLNVCPQGGGDLGQRMSRAFEDAFGGGFQNVVIVGTDCPELNVPLLIRALDSTEVEDLVLGPAADGGYYLIGLNRPVPALFDGISWGESDVLKVTMQIADSNKLTMALLEKLTDVDRPEDIHVWNRTISIIIPTLNEESRIARSLDSLDGASNIEVIVVDGESDDRTVDVARSRGVKVIRGPRFRAKQMNLGAAEAKGELLLFLHADTLLPPGFDFHVRSTLADRETIAGAFEFRTDSSLLSMRFIEKLVNWRSRKLKMPYGDQAIFVRKQDFFRHGRFPEIPAMDDFEFMKRLGRLGRITIAPAPAVTSARRWTSIGVWKGTAINQAMIICYMLGVSSDRLSRWYKRTYEKAGFQRRPASIEEIKAILGGADDYDSVLLLHKREKEHHTTKQSTSTQE